LVGLGEGGLEEIGCEGEGHEVGRLRGGSLLVQDIIRRATMK
jgi:hypothetical protein